MKRSITTFLIVLLLTIAGMAQSITGKIVDENGEPLDFVNAVLVNRADSSFIAGTVSGSDGSFEIPATATGAFVRLSTVGYITRELDVPPSGTLGTIAMEPDNIMLGEIVVKSTLPVTAIKGNALVTGVSGTVLAHAGTANDVLKQVPMILGSDGNFEVFGKGSPLIYINGRVVHDNTELAQLNSADIRDIEVITNPGARYDASVKAVVRIRTNRPQGEGFSGTFRAENSMRPRFVTSEQANVKFRSGGLEIFANAGYMYGKFTEHNVNTIVTRTAHLWNQAMDLDGYTQSNDMYGKIGFSYLFNDSHSIGAYYSNGFTKRHLYFKGESTVELDEMPYDKLSYDDRQHASHYPRHHANLYYNGSAGKLGFDFNIDYIWKKERSIQTSDETSTTQEDALVTSASTNHSRMFAEKLVLSWPLGKGAVEIGEEYTASRFSNRYSTDASMLTGSDTRVDEKNIAAFVQVAQQVGRFNLAAGLRYEHVSFNYAENGSDVTARSKTYNNLFPSLSVSTMFKDVQTALSYTHKTQRPSYAALDGTIDYINRFTLESGNPYLVPEKIHSVELMAAWRQFFAQVSYSYKKDPILHTTVPYGDDGELKLIIRENFPKIQEIEAFAGAQFKLGIWQPRVNAGILKQWLTVPYGDGMKKLDNPIAIVQFQNAIHLPADIWLNIDMQWMSAGNGENSFGQSSSYLNAKLYKAFAGNRFSVTLEANDIFNKGNRNFILYDKDVTIYRNTLTDNRCFKLTLQYNFNVTRDRYRGKGAGNDEQQRL